MKKMISLLAALLALTLCLSACSQSGASTVPATEANTSLVNGGVLCLKVNPEIAVNYDNDGKVTGVTARNDDALQVLAGYSFQGKDTKTVISELVTIIGEAGYFVEEIEGERRQITLEIEPGSALPDDKFLDDVIAEVKAVVEQHQWTTPLNVEGTSDYGISDYIDTDYGVGSDGATDYDDTDYGPDADGITDYDHNDNDDTDYGPNNDGVTDYDGTDYESNTDYGPNADGATDYDDTDYGPGSDGVTDYDDTDYGPGSNGVTDYDDTDYGSGSDGVTDYNDTAYGSSQTDYDDSSAANPPSYGGSQSGSSDYDSNSGYDDSGYDDSGYGES